jgi:hypothetical protein
LSQLLGAEDIEDGLREWLSDRKSRRAIPHRLERVGYVPVRNPYATDGLWKIYRKRQVVYAKSGLTIPQRATAAAALSGRSDH